MKPPSNGGWPLFNCLPRGEEPDWSRWEWAEAWPFYIEEGTGHALEWHTGLIRHGVKVAGWFVSLYHADGDEYERCTECRSQQTAFNIATYFTHKIREAK